MIATDRLLRFGVSFAIVGTIATQLPGSGAVLFASDCSSRSSCHLWLSDNASCRNKEDEFDIRDRGRTAVYACCEAGGKVTNVPADFKLAKYNIIGNNPARLFETKNSRNGGTLIVTYTPPDAKRLQTTASVR